MSLWDRVTQLFSRHRPAAEPTTSDEMRPTASPSELVNRMKADTERRQNILTCREMYKSDPRARRMMSTLARDMVRGGFTIKVKNNPKAEEAARALVKRLTLSSKLVKWIRLTLRDGDTFLELSVNGRNEISKVTRKPSLRVRRASNDTDAFDDPRRAYWIADALWTLPDPPADAVWFAEWQIVHARWDHDEDSRYGIPLFSSATGPYKRVKEGEVDVAIRRKTRAGMKYVHKFPPGTDSSVVDGYMTRNKDALDNPFAAVADYFGTVEISAVQGDARLQEIADVLHHLRTWMTASPVPVSLIGYGQDLNRDVLREQKDQYEEETDPLTQWVEDDLLMPLIERQWLMLGLWPESLEYEIEWTVKGKLSAADIRDAADAALRLRAVGLSDAVIMSILTRFLPGIDLEALQDAGGRRQEAGGRTQDAGRTSEADRLAKAAEAYGDGVTR
jgi:hypothetical protein